ncbi:S-adenosyl-L-methionine-dependent methyltransferase [Auricularia subglabra TFB-10046 SS5]|nr:S-adenosyl-L-methionine-dependent methyltransferase [Auricularia subglabra TFB-10046 SS5]
MIMADRIASAPPVRERFFNNLANSPYVLPADSEEGRRLNDQHEVVKLSAGGKILLAPIQLIDRDRVLDSGTGTGVWLADLASHLPDTVSLEGIDTSPHLFPPPSSVPPNITFSQYSILDLPQSFSSAFALVHQRLVIGAIRAEDWPDLLHTHFRLLRPGGWVQLCEIYPPGFHPSGGPRMARVLKMYDALAQIRGFDNSCAVRLADWARAAGFVNVDTLCTQAPVGVRAGDGPHNFTRPIIGVFLAMTSIMAKSGIAASEEEYEQAVRDMEDEWNGLDGAFYPFYWVWGQKPEEAAENLP